MLKNAHKVSMPPETLGMFLYLGGSIIDLYIKIRVLMYKPGERLGFIPAPLLICCLSCRSNKDKSPPIAQSVASN